MIFSPVEINVKFVEKTKTKVVKGVLLEPKELHEVIRLIDRSNAEGLKGKDALLLMRLKEAHQDVAPVKARSKSKGRRK